MNTVFDKKIIDFTSSPLSVGGFQDDSDIELSPIGEKRVHGARLQQVEGRAKQERDGRTKTQDYHAPAKPRESTTLRAAEYAFDQVVSTLVSYGSRTLAASTANSPAVTGSAGGKGYSLSNFENMTPEAMKLALTQLCVTGLGDVVKLKSEAIKIREEGAQALRLRQNEDLRKEIDTSIQDQQKAQKAGIFAVIVDWIIAVAEIISGVVKMAFGDFAGGAADFTAGCAGVVKAFGETMALADPDNAEKWKKLAEDAGKVQLSFEILGAAVDLFSVGKAVMVGKKVAEVAAKKVEEASTYGWGKMIAYAVKIGEDISGPAFQTLLQQFGKDVTEKVVKQATKELQESFFSQVLLAFNKEEMAKLVTKAAEKVVKKAVESGAEVAVESLSKEIAKQIARTFGMNAMKLVYESTGNQIKAAAGVTTNIVNTAAMADINKQRAELQKLIKELMAQGDFMQFLLDEFEKMKKRQLESMKDLLDSAGQAQADASNQIQKTGALLSNIAAQVA
ncbi:type III secretion system translocon protein [Dyella sp. M7H15-1]|uniref:type III secretion system translocon subunit SctE n=1 Tax=Dyella sp. M7H15-1 TaxID=2501295 RepID=UPI00100501D7|nr:type III secretion system translocon subunit SctE [Dyella sp. M7H15-1]QAU24329.1 type III secretion system translocon protein [Dyella sp. M7H15-1]